MNVKTIHLSDLFNKCEDIYTTVIVVAKRAKQIIDDRVIPIYEDEEVEDSIEFEEPIVTTYIDKPEAVAMEEFINGELQWRGATEDDQPVDES